MGSHETFESQSAGIFDSEELGVSAFLEGHPRDDGDIFEDGDGHAPDRCMQVVLFFVVLCLVPATSSTTRPNVSESDPTSSGEE